MSGTCASDWEFGGEGGFEPPPWTVIACSFS